MKARLTDNLRSKVRGLVLAFAARGNESCQFLVINMLSRWTGQC
jgi:hypothetical protein